MHSLFQAEGRDLQHTFSARSLMTTVEASVLLLRLASGASSARQPFLKGKYVKH